MIWNYKNVKMATGRFAGPHTKRHFSRVLEIGRGIIEKIN